MYSYQVPLHLISSTLSARQACGRSAFAVRLARGPHVTADSKKANSQTDCKGDLKVSFCNDVNKSLNCYMRFEKYQRSDHFVSHSVDTSPESKTNHLLATKEWT